MTTYKFLASDSASAMEEVVKKLGPDALIISTSKKGNKVEIEATNNLSNHQKHRDISGNFSDVLHSKSIYLEKSNEIVFIVEIQMTITLPIKGLVQSIKISRQKC